MSLRLLSANWGPPTHACITFEDGSPSVVPTQKIVDQSNLNVNDACEVKWTDGKGYRATIVALGGREKMEAKLAEMAEGKPQTCAIIANVYERTEVDSEDTEKEDQRSGGSEVKQKESSAVASTSKVSQTANCPTQRRLDAKRKRSQSEEMLKKSAQLLQHLSERDESATLISNESRHIKYKFPQTNEQQWQKILHVNMNSKCRSLRNEEKRKQCEESVTKAGVQADRGVHCRTDGDVGVHGHTDGDVDSSGDEADGGLLGSCAN
ncbi:hypothetical protein EMCRGX_G030296 [Ephydatia muelleri]